MLLHLLKFSVSLYMYICGIIYGQRLSSYVSFFFVEIESIEYNIAVRWCKGTDGSTFTAK